MRVLICGLLGILLSTAGVSNAMGLDITCDYTETVGFESSGVEGYIPKHDTSNQLSIRIRSYEEEKYGKWFKFDNKPTFIAQATDSFFVNWNDVRPFAYAMRYKPSKSGQIEFRTRWSELKLVVNLQTMTFILFSPGVFDDSSSKNHLKRLQETEPFLAIGTCR